MANATGRAQTLDDWIQGMIDRFESGKIDPKMFIQQVQERTVSSHWKCRIGVGSDENMGVDES